MSLLPETIRRVDELVADAQATGRVPALVAGVVRDGALLHLAAAGSLRVGAASTAESLRVGAASTAGTPPPPGGDTQYRIGSISKTLTAALVLQLRDEGRLALDDLLYRHLPGTPIGGVTLRQLLGHASGLAREPEGAWWERSAGLGLDAFLSALTPDKLTHPPHRSHHYSNLGYGLLGAVLARATGEDWRSLVTKRLLDPLGMGRTTYEPAEPYARGYVVHPWHETLREEPREDHGAMAPAGQLWSTVEDLARWAAFLADPRPEILAPATVTEMCAPVIMGDLDSWTSGHGLGLELWRVGERVVVGHTGSMPGYLAVLAVHRPSRTGVVGFANAYTLRDGRIGQFGLDLLVNVLDREPSLPAPWRPQSTAPGTDVDALCGRWWWMGREFEARWDAAAEELVITSLARGSIPWRFGADGRDRWRGRSGMNDGEVLAVHRSPAGVPEMLDIATFVFTREP